MNICSFCLSSIFLPPAIESFFLGQVGGIHLCVLGRDNPGLAKVLTPLATVADYGMGTGTKPHQAGLPKDFFVKLVGYESWSVIPTTWKNV